MMRRHFLRPRAGWHNLPTQTRLDGKNGADTGESRHGGPVYGDIRAHNLALPLAVSFG